MRISQKSILLLNFMLSSTAIVAADEPCITIGGWTFRTESEYNVDDDENNANDIQCTYQTLLDAFEDQVFTNDFLTGGDCPHSAEDEFLLQLGASDIEAGEAAVYAVCGQAQNDMRKIPISDVTYSEGSQFIENYYAGRSSWNEETETELYPGTPDTPYNVLEEDAQLVDTYYEHSQKSAFAMPELDQFDPDLCQAHAAMCCWPRDRQANDNNGNCDDPYDEDCVDKDVADNTDLCYVELGHAPYTNGIDADGISLFPNDGNNGEGAIHCHGFAWANDEQEILSRYKANNLFYVSMYDHMYTRGYVENIPGAPMCGCVEHMPIVSRSDCTQTNLEEYYTFTKKADEDGFTGVIDRIELTYQSCQGANNHNNDLEAFVEQLVADGKLTEAEQNIFNKTVVGDHQCDNAIEDALYDHGFEYGYNVDDTKWSFIVGEDFDEEVGTYDARLFKEMFEAQSEDFRIVRRVCPSCDETHTDIYYRRFTPLPEDFDLLDTLMNNWVDTHNEFNEDFALYSTYMDAFYDENRWTFCDFNDMGIGFPRNCGPDEKVSNNWNSYYKGGGRANYHAFLIPSNPSFNPSTVVNIASNGTASQISTSHSGDASRAIDGNTVGIYNNGFDSTTHTKTTTDPWWQLDFDYEVTFDKVYFWNRIDCCRDRLNGAVVAVIDKFTDQEVISVSFETAQVMNFADLDGVVGHALRIYIPGSSKILSLAEVQVVGTIGEPVVGNIQVKYFEIESWNSLGDLLHMENPYKEDNLWKIDYPSTGGDFATSGRSEKVAALFKGFIDFEEEDTYQICVESDDGSKLYVRGDLVVDNDGLHGMREYCADVEGGGIYSVWVEFFENGGGAGCIVRWQTPSSNSKEVVPASAWYSLDELPPTATPTATPTHDYAVRVKYYEIPGWSNLPADGFNDEGLNDIHLITTERIENIDIRAGSGTFGNSGRSDRIGAFFEGRLEFIDDGDYEICVTSDDGSKLYVDDILKIDNDGLHGDRIKCYTDFFEAGSAIITIEFFENGGGATCYTSWKKPGDSSRTVIPADSWLPLD